MKWWSDNLWPTVTSVTMLSSGRDKSKTRVWPCLCEGPKKHPKTYWWNPALWVDERKCLTSGLWGISTWTVIEITNQQYFIAKWVDVDEEVIKVTQEFRCLTTVFWWWRRSVYKCKDNFQVLQHFSYLRNFSLWKSDIPKWGYPLFRQAPGQTW